MTTLHRADTGQIIPREKRSYNERLFSGGWRSWLHESRYAWLRRSMQKLAPGEPSILELGCFDAKTIDYLPVKFSRYVGYDANWENGLSLGQARWGETPEVTLIESHDVSGFNPGNEQFDCSIALETLEHLPTRELDAYLQKLRLATRQYLFVSVPVEQGAGLLLKYLYKSVLFKVDEPYGLKELALAVSGHPGRVQRVERGHKGFDYRALVARLGEYFDIVSVEALPFSSLPANLNFSVGILARARNAETIVF